MNRTKRLLTLLLLVCGMTTGAWAQTAQLIRDGYLIKTFTGASSLSSAISAAASKGDIIILSSGSFNNPGNITKSVSIYGQGFENSTAIGGARTYISGKLEYKLMSEGALNGIHLEGLFIDNDLNILTNIGTNAVVDDFTVKKCHSGGVFFYQRSTNVKLQNCKFDRDVRTYPDPYTTTMQVDNCYIEGNLFNFADGSNIIVNNSLIHNNWYQNYSAATSFNNCIIYKNISSGSSATKCIFNQSSVSGSTDNCWMGVNNGDIYVAEGEDGTYSESKSFAVKDTYVGTDDTPVGLQGGIGWNKTPTIPSYLTPEDLTQDAEGYYLLGSVQDWQDFATLVQTTPTANARMTADINLGDDQTKVGTIDNPYQGTFDGQGYALTMAYVETDGSSNHCAPFIKIQNATIQNLHVNGSITTAGMRPAGITSYVIGTCNIRNCWSEVNIVASKNGAIDAGGLVTRVDTDQTLNMDDCKFTGSITYSHNDGYQGGGLIGWCQNNAYVNLRNSLYAPSAFSVKKVGSEERNQTLPVCGYQTSRISVTNSYYKHVGSTTSYTILQGTEATAARIANGAIAYNLQNKRTDLVWGQRIGVDAEPMLTSDESYRVYKSKNGGGTNDPDLAYTGLEQDAENYYLLGNEWAWQDFAALVQNTPTANARMTADINLGDDQTMIGTESVPYKGTFDGQGHTLTVNWTTTGNYCAPFPYINGATFKNLHVTGTINTSHRFTGGLIGKSLGTSYVNNCRSSVEMISSYSGDAVRGGFAASVEGGTLNFNDCIFDGKFEGASSQTWGGFVGWKYSYTVNIENGLFVPKSVNVSATYSATFSGNGGTVTNSYYTVQINNSTQGTQATAEQLADGTITYKLQNSREETVWVQDVLTNQPMLALFAKAAYTVPSSGLGTFSAKAKFALPEGLEAYYCTDYADGKISVVGIEGAVPAETGILLRGTPGETYTLTGTNSDAATVTDNALVAVVEPTHVNQIEGDYTNFMMSGGKFVKIAASNDPDMKMPANRAYLRILTSKLSELPSGAPITIMWGGEPTNIDALDSRPSTLDQAQPMYNIAGQRVSDSYKGIVIVNGKKYVRK